ncbi:TPA: hypothetical protein DDW35_12130, partial [Candidatus Sumerlaeota bacterium]|nr:hypothetical protein [Candidatus Sumerlaeota bacterium]
EEFLPRSIGPHLFFWSLVFFFGIMPAGMLTENTTQPPLLFRKTAPYLFLIVLALLALYPVFTANFVWEDETVLGSPQLHSATGLADIWLKPGQSILLDYMPLTYTTHWVEYQLWGMKPLGYHVVNLLLHITNALLLLYLLRRISMPGALLIAALFAVHPMQVSSVAWIVQRKDLLYTFFYFLAFLAWMRFNEKQSWQRYLLVLVLFTLSMLSKRMAITFPVAAFIYSWWRDGLITKQRILQLLPCLLIAFPLAYIVNFTLSEPATPPLVVLSIPQKFILVGRNLFYYVGKLLWPSEHVPFYPPCSLNVRQPLLCLFPITVLAALLALWKFRRRIGRGPIAAAAFYIATLLPVLGVAYWCLMGRTYVQDHYQYVSSIAAFMLVGYGVSVFAPRLFCHADKCFAAALLLPLVLVAQQHTALYQDCETLFTPNFAKYPTVAPEIAHNLAVGLLRHKKLPQALYAADYAVRLKEDDAQHWQLKGDVLMELHQLKEARAAYEKGLQITPHDENLINNYASTYIFYGDSPNPESAIPLLLDALSRHPRDFRLNANLGFAYKVAGKKIEAAEYFGKAVALNPARCNPEILYQYGTLLIETGQAQKAIAPLRQACAQINDPRYVSALRQAETAPSK